MESKSLYIISSSYPFGEGEEFVRKELKELSRYFEKIHLFPLSANGLERWLPENVSLDLSLAHASRNIPRKQFFINSILLLKIIGIEFFKTNKKKFIFFNVRTLANSILQSKKMAEIFEEKISREENNFFYSIWMNDGALIFSMLKQEKKIQKFVFRLHGYDLFDERRKGDYMPFRYYNFSNAQRVFVLSKAGYNYIRNKNIFPEKLIVNYSGVYDNGNNPFDPTTTFAIVTCSNVIGIKRLDKVVDSLALLDFPVNWIHFGDGELLNSIKEKAKSLPSYIHSSFRGVVDNEEILSTYKNISINLFLHLSDSEGLGMVLVEAQSFGIPSIAVNVGGVSEVVNEKTGILINRNLEPKEIAKTIAQFKGSEMNTVEFRKSVKDCWKQKFNADVNYEFFYKNLISDI